MENLEENSPFAEYARASKQLSETVNPSIRDALNSAIKFKALLDPLGNYYNNIKPLKIVSLAEKLQKDAEAFRKLTMFSEIDSLNVSSPIF